MALTLATSASAYSGTTVPLPDGLTPGDLVVDRIGDGVIARDSSADATFLDEFTPAGVYVGSIPMSTTGSAILTNSGTGTSEGMLGISQNGQYVALFGYNTALGTAGVKSTVSRTIACVTAATGSVAYTTGNLGGADNARSVTVSNDGQSFWNTWGHQSGGVPGGVNYIQAGTNVTPTAIYSAAAGAGDKYRDIEIFGGQLYLSGTGTGGDLAGVAAVGAGLPTSASSLNQLSGVGSGEAFFLADLNPDVGIAGGYDTLYIAVLGGQNSHNGYIAKYSLEGSSWVAKGTTTANVLESPQGLTGVVSGGNVTLYTTYGNGATDSNTTYLGAITDNSGYDGTLSGSVVQLVGAGTVSPDHEAYRGIQVVPEPVPEPSSIVLAGIAGLFGLIFAAWRRGKSAW